MASNNRIEHIICKILKIFQKNVAANHAGCEQFFYGLRLTQTYPGARSATHDAIEMGRQNGLSTTKI